MGTAIGQMLPAAVGVAISPMPIVAVVLVLVTPKARTNGLAFLVGWLAGILVVGGIVLAIVDPAGASDGGKPATWADVLKLALGVLLLLLAVKQWRGKPDAEAGGVPATPTWMGALDSFTPVKSLGVAAVLAGANPKNLLLIVAGAEAIAQTGISGGQEAIVWVVFVVIASLGVGVPIVIYFALGDRAPAILDGVKVWMIRHNGAIMAMICLLIGVKLVGDAITGFSS